MTDPITPSARLVLKESLGELRAAVEGVPAEALNWRPAGEETNSMAALAIHVLHGTRSWLSVAVAGTELGGRDRSSEFLATEDDPGALSRLVDEMSAECALLLRDAGEVDWSAMRKIDALAWDSDVREVPAAWAILHALEHLGQHVAHASLTRQLWVARNGATDE